MFVKLTLSEAKNLRPGTILYWMGGTNADGSPQKYKVNGEVKKWVTRPEEFRIPVKRGLRQFAYVTEKEIDRFRIKVDPSVSFSRFTVDYFAEQTDGICSVCEKTISEGWLCLDGGEEYCEDCLHWENHQEFEEKENNNV